MYTFLASIATLIIGFFVYGFVVDKIFVIDPLSRTPAYKLRDGVDFVPLKRWRIFLIQFLNIAGLGPIFGAIMGAFYGPSAFLWIVFGCIFGGAVHDYLIGMMSVRSNGVSLPEVLGQEFGHYAKHIMRFLSAIIILLLLLLTTSFLEGVAVMLQDIIPLPSVSASPEHKKPLLWLLCIFLYFGIATVFPIDKIIGRFYPIFGLVLLFMGVGVSAAMLINHSAEMPEIFDGLQNRQANNLPIFPMMFMSISCGAISGFHGTQATIMSRCITNERQGRFIFYGAMISEGVLALIWAFATVTFFTDPEQGTDGYTGLNLFAAQHPGDNIAALVVNKVCRSWLGVVGGFLAVLGVIFAPVTSGDTALRSARLMIADAIEFDQTKIKNRMLLTSLLLVVITVLLFVDFNPLWRFFSWLNQIIAACSLWGGTVFLFRQEYRPVNPTKYKFGFLIAFVPAVFMTYLCICYILLAPEGLNLLKSELPALAHLIATALTLFVVGCFLYFVRKFQKRSLSHY